MKFGSKIVLGLFVCLLMVQATGPQVVRRASITAFSNAPLQPHDPIWITGNAEFTSLRGVSGGTGTAADPFIIQGWDIDLSCLDCHIRVPTGYGILIDSTSAYFVVRNVSIHDGATSGLPGGGGVKFSNVQNGLIQGAVLAKDTIGFDIDYSSHNVFKENQVSSNDIPFYLFTSSFNTFISNRAFSAGKEGFVVQESADNVFVHNIVDGGFAGFDLTSLTGRTTRNTLAFNTVVSVGQSGFDLNNAPGNRLVNNTAGWIGACVNSMVFTCPDGFHLEYGANNNILTGNLAYDNPNDGFLIENSAHNLLTNNVAHGSHPLLPGTGPLVGLGAGFALFTATENTLVSNVAYNNDVGFDLSLSSHNRFSSNIARANVDGFDLFDDSRLNVFDHNQVYGSSGWGGFYLDSINGNGLSSDSFVYNSVHDNVVGFRLGSGVQGDIRNNTIAFNTIYSNNAQSILPPYANPPQGIGILLDVAETTNVHSNFIFNNLVGIVARVNALTPLGGGGGYNRIANNMLSNAVNVQEDELYATHDSYNITKTLAPAGTTNIVGGAYFGGNFWNDYTGSDPDGDGIGDTPYTLYSSFIPGYPLATDYYPLVFGPASSTAPDFTMLLGLVAVNGVTVNQGSNSTFLVAILSRNAFSGTVTLSATVSPSMTNGPRIGFEPSAIVLPSRGTLLSAVNITSTLVPGTYTLDLMATTPTISHTKTMQLTIVIVSNPSLTTTTVACDPSTVLTNQVTSCTATVADLNPAATTPPTGTITFTPGGTCTLSGTSSSSACSVSITPTTSGTLQVSAAYAGSATEAPSTGSTVVIVTTGRTVTTVTCTPSMVSINQATTCTATVTDISQGTTSTPTGTIAWTTTSLGTFDVTICTLAGSLASASCHVTYTPTTTGSHQIAASYSGDTTHPTSSSSFTISVGARPTATTVVCTPSLPVIGQTTACTATVIDNGATPMTPTGTVTVTPSNSCILSSTGASSKCSINLTPTQAGPLTISATYGGDATHASSSGVVTITVSKRSTSAAVSCGSSVVIGQGSMCSVTVTDTSPGATMTPTGTVSFASTGTGGTFSPTTCALASGSCSVTFTTSTSGSTTVNGNYAGDMSHGVSTGSSSVSTSLRSTATAVICLPYTVISGLATSCTISVTDNSVGSSTTPTGTVNFASSGIGAFASSNCTLGGTGATASCSVVYTPIASTPRTDSIIGNYAGDTRHEPSSNIFSLSVNIQVNAITSVSVSCNPTTVKVTHVTSCTATVTDASTGPTIPTGTISFVSDGTGSFAGYPSCTLTSGLSTGSATCSVEYTPTMIGTGTHTVTANYGGDSGHSGSHGTSQVSVTRQATGTTVGLVCSPSPMTTGGASTCRLTVAGLSSSPTGGVTFSASSSNGGVVSLSTYSCTLASGRCSISVTGTAVGTVTITSTYAGDADNLANSSSTTLIVENQASSGSPANPGNSNGASSGGQPIPTGTLLIGGGIVAMVGIVTAALFRLRSGRRSRMS